MNQSETKPSGSHFTSICLQCLKTPRKNNFLPDNTRRPNKRLLDPPTVHPTSLLVLKYNSRLASPSPSPLEPLTPTAPLRLATRLSHAIGAALSPSRTSPNLPAKGPALFSAPLVCRTAMSAACSRALRRSNASRRSRRASRRRVVALLEAEDDAVGGLTVVRRSWVVMCGRGLLREGWLE